MSHCVWIQSRGSHGGEGRVKSRDREREAGGGGGEEERQEEEERLRETSNGK